MFRTPTTVPLLLLQLETLLSRLPSNYLKRQTIEDDLAMQRAGYRGEVDLKYYLENLPEDKYEIYHGLRIPTTQGNYFQMDFLLIAKQYLVVIEVKNIKGILEFDPDFDQLIRHYNQQTQCFSCPINQVNLQIDHLQKWFEKKGFNPLHIYPLVVISSPSTVIKTISNRPLVLNHVLHAQGLMKKLLTIEKQHRSISNIENTATFESLNASLLRSHAPRKTTIMEKYSIEDRNLLIKGIRCPSCNKYAMKKVYGGWLCEACRYTKKDAHKQAIKEYQLLFGSGVKVSEIKEFLGIECSQIMRRLLIPICESTSKSGKETIYRLPVVDEW